MRSFRFFRLVLPVLALSVVLSGCGDSAVDKEAGTVSGTVKFENKLLSEGVVTFEDKQGNSGRGKVDSGGKYTIDNPLPPGEYTVTVVPLSAAGMDVPPGESGSVDRKKKVKSDARIPKAYHNHTTTDLKFTIKAGENTYNIKMTKGGGKRESGGGAAP
ncbi:MAG: carboxypeptidase regulatory-like domain-containing protein [Planctomycetes bacterium]|nr:carboxypeptidase regulatory-like domain-containing protein [Planctomycetota bacterium]